MQTHAHAHLNAHLNEHINSHTNNTNIITTTTTSTGLLLLVLLLLLLVLGYYYQALNSNPHVCDDLETEHCIQPFAADIHFVRWRVVATFLYRASRAKTTYSLTSASASETFIRI
jgi:hypothetical protein